MFKPRKAAFFRRKNRAQASLASREQQFAPTGIRHGTPRPDRLDDPGKGQDRRHPETDRAGRRETTRRTVKFRQGSPFSGGSGFRKFFRQKPDNPFFTCKTWAACVRLLVLSGIPNRGRIARSEPPGQDRHAFRNRPATSDGPRTLRFRTNGAHSEKSYVLAPAGSIKKRGRKNRPRRIAKISASTIRNPVPASRWPPS